MAPTNKKSVSLLQDHIKRMKKIALSLILILSLSALPGWGQPSSYHNGELLVDGKPFTLLAGELHNSTTGSVAGQRDVWARMKANRLNTVIAAMSWELVEPEENHFDFTVLDAMIDGAREQGLKLVVLWFGSWKNGVSTYVPAWVKKDGKRFPRAAFKGGNPAPYLSALGKNTMQADAKAFARMMAHIRDYDKDGTVILVQVENEMGTLDMMSTYMGGENRSRRDYSPAADKAFKGKVPDALTAYLKAHERELHPAVLSAWERSGKRSSGTWEEVFGQGDLSLGESWQDTYPGLTEELFNAWNYATYVEHIAAVGKKEYNLPMFVNAWLKQESGQEPGKYPSGGAQAHLFDIWRAAAPSIDFYAVDIYATRIYDWVCSTFSSFGNPLFIPETTSTPDGASRAFYTFGRYQPLCYAPFGIDGGGVTLSADPDDPSFRLAYTLLESHMDEIRGGNTIGLLLDPANGRNTDSAVLGKYRFSLRPNRLDLFAATAGVSATGPSGASSQTATGVLVLQKGEDEFLVLGGVGSGSLSVSLAREDTGKTVDILSVDEIRTDTDGSSYLHRLNGDETSMGVALFRTGTAKAFLVKLYQY